MLKKEKVDITTIKQTFKIREYQLPQADKFKNLDKKGKILRKI